MQGDRVFLKGSVYSGNHLQEPGTTQMIRPPKLPETIILNGGGGGGRNMWLSWVDSVLYSVAVSAAFYFYFCTILKSDRFCRPFCPRTWVSSKALFLKDGFFTLPAPATSSVSKFPGLTEVNFHFCKSQAATCFWEVNKPSEKCWWLVFHCFTNIFIQWHHSTLNKSLKRIKKQGKLWSGFYFFRGRGIGSCEPSIVFDSFKMLPQLKKIHIF